MPRSKKLPISALIVAIVNLALFIPCLCCSGAGAVIGPAMGDGSGFVGDPKKSGEKILEAIQMAWVDEVED